jgi:hypothetical protein
MTGKTESGPLGKSFSSWSEHVAARIDPDLRAAARVSPWFRNPRIRISISSTRRRRTGWWRNCAPR